MPRHYRKDNLLCRGRFYSRRRGRRTNMILYSLFIIIYKKSTKQKSPAAGLAA